MSARTTHTNNANRGAALRADASALSQSLPALQAEAERLARTIALGGHGRRQSGRGDEFWQYRAAQPGDPARLIDWRRSGRSDGHFVREKEWQAAQSVHMWVDRSAAMQFSSAPQFERKQHRAAVLALALAQLLMDGGERVGLTALDMPPRNGRLQLSRIAQALVEEEQGDFGIPASDSFVPQSRAVFFSDCLGDIERFEQVITRAAQRGIKGTLVQILDPAEESFPFDGRTLFSSMSGDVTHETLQAADLRARYVARLAERKAHLARLTRETGWRYTSHRTDEAPLAALLWLYRAVEGTP